MKRWLIILPLAMSFCLAGVRGAGAQDFQPLPTEKTLTGYEGFGLEPLASKTSPGKGAKTSPSTGAKADKKDRQKPQAEEGEDPDKANLLWFGFSARLDLMTIDLSTREYLVGLTPGLGWGIRWRPYWWTLTDALFAADLFFEASIQPTADASNNYGFLRMTVMPVITLLDSLSVGFGVTYNLSLVQGQKDTLGTILSVGLGTALNKSPDAAGDDADEASTPSSADGESSSASGGKKPGSTGDKLIISNTSISRLRRDYLSLAMGCGASVPLVDSASLFGVGYRPVFRVLYNFVQPWGVLSAGLSGDVNADPTLESADYKYWMYSVPIAAHIGYETGGKSAYSFFAGCAAGLAISVVDFGGVYAGVDNVATTCFYLGPEVGAAFHLSPHMNLRLYADGVIVFFPSGPYISLVPGLCFEFDF